MKKFAILLVMLLPAFSVLNAHMQTMTAERGNGPEYGKEVKSAKPVKSEKAPVNAEASESVSAEIMTNFDIDYPKAEDVVWHRTDNLNQAIFTNAKDGLRTSAYYDFDGNLVGSTTAKKLADLPEKAIQIIKTAYKDYSVGPIIYFLDNPINDTDMVLWATVFNDTDMYFAELDKGTQKIIVRITPSGDVSYFKEL
jgi:hypothetical protein